MLGTCVMRRGEKAQVKKIKIHYVYFFYQESILKKSKSHLFCVNIRDCTQCLIKGRFAMVAGVVFLERARKTRVTENRPQCSRLLSCCLCLSSSSSWCFSLICLTRRTMGKDELVRAAAGPLEQTQIRVQGSQLHREVFLPEFVFTAAASLALQSQGFTFEDC